MILAVITGIFIGLVAYLMAIDHPLSGILFPFLLIYCVICSFILVKDD